MNKICVLGLGYIGLPTAALFAGAGMRVIGVDINRQLVERVNQGQVEIQELGLPELVEKAVGQGQLKAGLQPEPADVFIIAVPTPIHPNYQADLSHVMTAIDSILPYLQKGNLIIVESTLPPRTTKDIIAPYLAQAGWNVEEELYLAYCPERVLPGRILTELVENTRIVGGYTARAAQRAAELYRLVVQGEILETEAETAEMSKLMENTYRDVNIALANELTKIAADLHLNALEVIRLANHHPRVQLHWPGPGVGGHCIAVDPYFIIEKAAQQAVLISTARKINQSMPAFVVEQLSRKIPLDGTIAVLGITYKGNVSDIRESPALVVIEELNNRGYQTKVHDPYVSEESHQLPFSLVAFEEAIQGANALLVLSDHQPFVRLNEEAILSKMETPLVFDTKNCVQIQSPHITYINFNYLSS